MLHPEDEVAENSQTLVPTTSLYGVVTWKQRRTVLRNVGILPQHHTVS